MKDTTPCSDTASQAITSQCRVASRHHHTVSPAARNNTIMSVDQHRSRQNCHLFSNITSVLLYLTTSNRRTTVHTAKGTTAHIVNGTTADQRYSAKMSLLMVTQSCHRHNDAPTSRLTAYKLSCPLYNQQRTHLCKIIKYQNQDSLTAYQNV